jgi:predicted nucleic acid-binding Zn ribbon protein
MNKTMRKCVVCGKKFTPKSANAITCSEKCYKARKAANDKARKAAKKTAVKTEAKPEVKKEEKKPVAKKVAKKTCPKAIKGKATEKIKLPNGCDTVVRVEGKDDFKVVALAFAIAMSALGRIISGNKIKSL